MVRQLIVGLMLKTPERIQVQLSEAIGIIGREDFPDKWPELLAVRYLLLSVCLFNFVCLATQEMIEKFSSADFHIINGVLKTGHSLFKRYRHEFKSDALWTEIKFVLDVFAAPMTDLLQV